MRTGLFTLVFGLLISTGCATAPEVETVPPEIIAAHPAVQHHYEQAQSLAASISKRDDASLLDRSANAEVLALAREQNCLARYTRDPSYAQRTVEMVDAYLDLHDALEQEPSFLLRVRAKQMIRDAESAGRGVISPASLGCLPNSMPRRGPRAPWSPTSVTLTQSDDYGTGLPWNQMPRSVPGGVIR